MGRSTHTSGSSAFSLVEAMVAVGIIGLSLGAMMTLSGQQLRLVKVTKDNNAAALYQQERIEQLRQARWPDLTSGTFLRNQYMSERPKSRAALSQIAEVITVSPYPAAQMSGRPLKVTQPAAGAATIDETQTGSGLVNERLVAVEMTLGWRGADGRGKQRKTTTLISNSGVTRSNLPALGPVSGGPWQPFEGGPGTSTTSGGDGGGQTSGGSSGSTGGSGGGETAATGGTSSGGTNGGGTGGGTTNGGGTGGGRGNTGGKGGKK